MCQIPRLLFEPTNLLVENRKKAMLWFARLWNCDDSFRNIVKHSANWVTIMFVAKYLPVSSSCLFFLSSSRSLFFTLLFWIFCRRSFICRFDIVAARYVHYHVYWPGPRRSIFLRLNENLEDQAKVSFIMPVLSVNLAWPDPRFVGLHGRSGEHLVSRGHTSTHLTGNTS